MANPLLRLLRLRSLLEDSSRMEVERRAALAARIDGAKKRERDDIRSSREWALRAICEGGPASEQAGHRAAAWMNVESATWREQQLQPLAQAAQRRVAQVRDEFLERRKERRQVESVLEQRRECKKIEQERRIQRDLDDWFGMNQIRQRRAILRDHEKFLTSAPSNPLNHGN